MKRFILILIMILFLVGFSFGQFKLEIGWEQILPVKSNRAEVEEKLGKPTEESEFRSRYDTEDATISFRFTLAPCSGEGLGRFNVPINTVYSYIVSIKNELLVSDLNRDSSRYRKSKLNDREITVDYSNSRDSITFETLLFEGKERVLNIFYYFPEEKFKNLECKGTEK